MEQKKLTKAQLERKVNNMVVKVEKTRNTKSIYFTDKGLRLTVTDDYAVIETGFHRHVFDKITSASIGEKESPYSRPYLYTERFIDMALENDCATENGYSYSKLFHTLKDKEDKADFNLATYTDWWFSIIFDNLYAIHESDASSWLVFLKYVNMLAINGIVLEEREADLTNKQFLEKFVEKVKELTQHIAENVVLTKPEKEDAEFESADAMAEFENEQIIENHM